VCAATGGPPVDGLIVAEVHQEHGMIAGDGAGGALEAQYPVGSRVRVLPNHACLMAAPYDRYYLVRGTGARVEGEWAKVTGWSPAV
jgi:D-serine deaminase-like pyridoxal phosphate-dependent protein